MASYINIPTPCHEDWNSMSLENQGRHCLKCSKTVIDFTGWEATDIAAYLEVNEKNKVCGRFNTLQLNIPIAETPDLYLKKIYYANVSIFKKIAAIFFIAFGLSATSCNTNTTGEAVKKGEPITYDTTRPVETVQMGGIKKYEKPDTTFAFEPPIMNAVEPVSQGVPIYESYITGTPALEPEPQLAPTDTTQKKIDSATVTVIAEEVQSVPEDNK